VTPLATASEQPDVEQVALTYRSLRAMTKEPVYVNPMFAAMCRNVSQEEVEAARKVFGPHANTAVRIYMNDLAADTFGKANPVYPVGAIVVKEKEAMGYSSATQPGSMVLDKGGVGGMIKRPAGYDSAHGDWEYFYFEDPGKVESGKIISCVQCHSGAAGQDYVFGSWAHGNPWH
jgi:hypothetical protein